MTKYTRDFKASLVNKVLSDPGQSIRAVATEAQVGVSSLHGWVHTAKNQGSIKEDRSAAARPCDWPAAQRLQAVIESSVLDHEALNQYCRQQGIYKHQLIQWKQNFMSDKDATQLSKQQRDELKALRDQNKQLQRDLSRKEKALAEASALLILKKKADLIWPVNEVD